MVQGEKGALSYLENQGGVLMDCLMIICRAHNISVSRASLLSGLPLDNGELSPTGFERAAHRAGLASRTAKRDMAQINAALLPAVLIMEGRQACVLHELTDDSAKVSYPELDTAVVSVEREQIASQFTGYIIFARPVAQSETSSGKVEKNAVGHWLWSSVKSAYDLYRDVLLASIFISLLSIALPLFVMNVYDRVVPNAAMETLWALAIGVLLVLAADFLLRVLRQYFVELAASRLDVTMSAKIMEKVLSIDLTNRPAKSGAFINSLQSFESIRHFFGSLTLVALVDLPFGLLFVFIIAMIDIYLVIPILLGTTILFLYALKAQRVMRSLSEESMEISARKSSLITESVTALEDLKAFGYQSRTQSAWEKQTIFLAKVNAKLRLVSMSVNNSALWIQQSVGVVIILTGVYLIIEGEITQGGLIAAYLLSSRAMGPVSQAAALLAQYHQAETAKNALDDIMSLPSEGGDNKQVKNASQLSGNLDVKQLCFRYPNENVLALKDINFSIKQGEHVAILGKNGCGKSTLNRLLMGFYKAESGQVLLDEIDMKQYDPVLLRQNIGYVPQDVNLFSGTLKENILPAHRGVDDERLWEIAKQCGLAKVVNSHGNGFEQQVGEGGKQLSGGQRQSVSLARALIYNPAIFIMDEPTSAMDSANEAMMKETIREAIKGKTFILNTHRTTLLDLVDRVIVIENGKIIADGKKEDVLPQFKPVPSKQRTAK
ncbi:type I secretion system permease/ATPase [Alteromonas stellipolaris]|uniref:type I secretion system permease/ATPase n=1 Tax=Alteromonas stellipolaris TaxID=233316 RepID=UPI0026E1A9D4|nr:type I secretion system permease/ATPase [Alteromonas stellipolaris]MDO6536572.1 type I secretion system permease/ATPase [Alteromonas stellipolaris]MDO6625963.1 type I secretion system permease/ATPase [Alteromonas stellipolaris]